MNRQFWLRVHGWLFTGLLLAVLGGIAWASSNLPQAWYWGGAFSRTLSPPSQRLLATLDEAVNAYGFAQPGQLVHRHLEELLGLYRAENSKFDVTMINPQARPDLVREFGVERVGEVVLEYAGRREQVAVPTEDRISSALERLLRRREQHIAFLTGHGERDLLGEANHDLGAFGQALTGKGYRLQPLSLMRLTEIPDNTALLVLTPPQTELLAGERAALSAYLERGGNLLWLADPDEHQQLDFLAEQLAIRWQPGVVVDSQAAETLAVDDARLVLVDDYPAHAVTERLRAPALLVQAAALRPPATGWQVQPLLEPDAGQAVVEDYPDGAAKPLRDALLGLTLERAVGDGRQRIGIIGDGDFLANSHLGNGANLPLGLNLIDWLTDSELFLGSYSSAAPDQRIELGRWQVVLLAGGLLLVLPGGFLGFAGWRWWRRRRG